MREGQLSEQAGIGSGIQVQAMVERREDRAGVVRGQRDPAARRGVARKCVARIVAVAVPVRQPCQLLVKADRSEIGADVAVGDKAGCRRDRPVLEALAQLEASPGLSHQIGIGETELGVHVSHRREGGEAHGDVAGALVNDADDEVSGFREAQHKGGKPPGSGSAAGDDEIVDARAERHPV